MGPRSLTAEPMTTTATQTKEYGGWLELSRSALHRNLAGVRGLAEPAQIMAVVKADAYGAGATGMASALQDGGVTRFAVATVDEAVALCEAGIHGEILCLTYFDPGDAQAIQHHDLTLTVFSKSSVSTLAAIAGGSGGRLRIWVKDRHGSRPVGGTGRRRRGVHRWHRARHAPEHHRHLQYFERGP